MADYSPPFQAANSQRAMELYGWRSYYKAATEDIFAELPNFIDLWYNTPYYGKADLHGKLVVVNPNNLKFSIKDNVTLLNFVFDAFEDFRKFLNHATQRGRTTISNTLFGGCKAKKSYQDPFLQYFNYGASVLDEYHKYLRSSTKTIATVRGYIQEFLVFLSQITNIFTFSSYYASSAVNINSTGLAVELWDAKAGSDLEKNKIFRHPDFYTYVQAAANFGLRIDKNAPWRLIADLKSKPMETYRVKRNISTLDAVFSGYYQTIDFYDLYATGALLYSGYQKYQRSLRFSFETWHCMKADFRMKAAIIADVVSKSKKITFEALHSLEFFSAFLDVSFVRALERMKNIENRPARLRNYNFFQKRFENSLRSMPGSSPAQAAATALELLYDYYNPTKIYAPHNLRNPHYIGGPTTKSTKVLTFKQGLSTMYKTQIGIPGPQTLDLTKL
jgi:hypothetical protein